MEPGKTGDRITGALLAAGGLVFAWYAAETYNMGTLRRMGPGMFPVGLGLMLAGLGLAILVFTPDRRLRRPDFAWPVAAKVVAAIIAFGLVVRLFGLLPAIMATVVIAAFADHPFRPLSALALGGFLCLLSWLIFRVALGLPIPLLVWPF